MPCGCGVQIYTDALIECARALSALLNGSPDNHLAMSSLGITAVAVSALDTIARVPLTRHPEHTRRRIDDACDALSALMAVFCRHEPLPLLLEPFMHVVWEYRCDQLVRVMQESHKPASPGDAAVPGRPRRDPAALPQCDDLGQRRRRRDAARGLGHVAGL